MPYDPNGNFSSPAQKMDRESRNAIRKQRGVARQAEKRAAAEERNSKTPHNLRRKNRPKNYLGK